VIRITTESGEKRLKVRIMDNGIGIKPKHRRKVFEKFYRVPTGDLHDVKGFGLGLEYVDRIVKMHQGTIEVEENEQKGSTFILTFKND
jgi:signal transduction histidine kinase